MAENIYFEFSHEDHARGIDQTSSTNYIEEVLANMHREQSDHLYCKFSEAYIKYRRVVAQWMVDVADYFNMHPTTTHAAVAYLDRLQPNEKFSRFEWQMMAICCILISAKYNECEEHLPPLNRLEEITQQVMTNECVLNYELWALKRMGWKLNARTPMAFLETYMSLGRALPPYQGAGAKSTVPASDSPLRSSSGGSPTTPSAATADMSFYSPAFQNKIVSLAAACMFDYRYKGFKASAVACAILFFARQQSGVQPAWRPELTQITLHDPFSSKSVQAVLEMLRIAHGQPVAGAPLSPPLPLSPAAAQYSRDLSIVTPPRPELEESYATAQESSFSDSEASTGDAVTGLASAIAASHLTPQQPSLQQSGQGGGMHASKDKENVSPVSIAGAGDMLC